MLETLNNWIVLVMDYLLGWMLYLPSDARLILVAVMTSTVLVVVRRWSTNQEWLGRAEADRRRLRQLARQAKADKPARKQYKATMTLIKARSMKHELKPLLWAIVPIALLGTWAFSRLGYEPLRCPEEFQVKAYMPVSAIGQRVQLLPTAGQSQDSSRPHLAPVDQAAGWITTVAKDKPVELDTPWDRFFQQLKRPLAWAHEKLGGAPGAGPALEGVACWRLAQSPAKHNCAWPNGENYVLTVRYDGRNYSVPLLIDSVYYAGPTQFFDGTVQAVEVVHKPLRLFNFVGGLESIYLPPWLVAYLLIAIPFVSVVKRVLRIH